MNTPLDEIKKLKSELLDSAKSLFSGATNAALLRLLNSKFPDILFAIIVNWIPEQGEDIYWLLVSDATLIVAEVPRNGAADESPKVEVIDVQSFRKRKLSAETQRRFEAALEIMRENGHC